jgi:hypothetical protein
MEMSGNGVRIYGKKVMREFLQMAHRVWNSQEIRGV